MIQSYKNHIPHIHPTSYIHPSSVLIGDIIIHEEVSIWPGVVLRGDDGQIIIQAQSNLQDGVICHLTHDYSHTLIGKQVTVGHGAILHGCIINNLVLVGMGAIILDNAHIGEYSLIGAGTLILANQKIPPRSLVLGNPGRIIREVNEREIMMIELGWQTYVDRMQEYKKST